MPGAAPGGGVASCAFIPAFTVSIKTPVDIAGEYWETRLASGGWGSGGIGGRRPPRLVVGWGDLDFVVAGCLPLVADDLDGGCCCSVVFKGVVLYGALGTFSGFRRCIWRQIISNSCFSAEGVFSSDKEEHKVDILVWMAGLMRRPSCFHCTRTRPGFSQSRGWDLFTSCRVPRPRRLVASAMSLLSGHQTLLGRATRRSPVP